MYKLVLISLLVFLGNYVLAQNHINLSVVVIDKSTKKAIPFATVYVLHKNIYLDAGDNGSFYIDLEKSDSISLSCVGYKTQIFSANDLNRKSKIELEVNTKILENVYVGNFAIKQFGIGNQAVSASMSANRNDRSEYATLITIPNEYKKILVTRIKIKVRDKNSKKINPVRINLYNLNQKGMPGDQLLKQDIVLTSSNIKNGFIDIDISDQDLILSAQNLFVAVQWIADKKEINYDSPQISFTKKIKNSLTWLRSLSLYGLNYNWLKLNGSSATGNMIANIEVKILE